MKSFTVQFLQGLSLPLGTSWLLSECMQAKGQQDLWQKKKPETLLALKDLARIQSVESSNRIEGVEVEQKRLEPLILGKTTARSRPEEEIIGYKKALELIHKKHSDLELNTKLIQRLHDLAQKGAGDAGVWKSRNNEILEFDIKGQKSVRFVPTPAQDVDEHMNQMCLRYLDAAAQNQHPLLILVSLFILDFLCIHPFRDGNGRVSRLLTTLLLSQNGFSVGQYVSLERLTEESKFEYYSALKESSQSWHTGQHNPLPWINFFLSTLRRAYKELDYRIENQNSITLGKSDLLREIILHQLGSFTLSEIQLQAPSVSAHTIKKVLGSLKKEKKVSLKGHGRSARWKVNTRQD